jgi:hypothetical protein
VAVYALSVHADYACRHSGACCTAGWSIPVEPRVRPLLNTALLVPDSSNACPQFDRESGLCIVHRDHGEGMLPMACHQFPRRALIDDRGTFVTLSHFCPTAAALLHDAEGPLTIASAPTAFPAARHYEGLDARGEWPPLLRRGVLFDLDSYAKWERFIVSSLALDGSVRSGLTRIAGRAERLRAWTPALGSFADWADASLQDDPHEEPDHHLLTRIYGALQSVDAYAQIGRTVPEGLDAPKLPDGAHESLDALASSGWDRHARSVRRYLAAKGFASWSAYQGVGIRTLVAELVASATVLRVECARACARAGRALDRSLLIEAIRASDWLLVHLVDRTAFIRWLGAVEQGTPGRLDDTIRA